MGSIEQSRGCDDDMGSEEVQKPLVAQGRTSVDVIVQLFNSILDVMSTALGLFPAWRHLITCTYTFLGTSMLSSLRVRSLRLAETIYQSMTRPTRKGASSLSRIVHMRCFRSIRGHWSCSAMAWMWMWSSSPVHKTQLPPKTESSG